jgi:hypothetical protein
MKKLVPLLLIAGGIAVFLFLKLRKGGVQDTGYTVSTPFGGGSLLQDPLSGTVQISATLKKQAGKKKKKGIFKKIGGFVKKNANLIAGAAAFIPGIGPAASQALMKASSIRVGNQA